MEMEESIALDSNLQKHDNITEDRISYKDKTDVTDIPPKHSRISNLDIFFLGFAITTHIVDIFVDLNLMIQYYLHDQITTFIWTISLILVPSFIITIVSSKMYQKDEEEKVSDNEQSKCSILQKIKNLALGCFTVIFQMTMTRRCFKTLTYAIKSRKYESQNNKLDQHKYFIKMLKGEEDMALLRVLECFIEAAPQQILQLAFFVKDYKGELTVMSLHQIINIASSFVLMAWSMASYHRSIRLPQWDKKNISLSGTILQFFWHFFITISRISCVCAVALIPDLMVLVLCFFHWIGMTTWIIMQSRGVVIFCQNPKRIPHSPLSKTERISSVLFSCVLGFVYIFNYLNPEDDGTFRRYLIYYIICFVENISASILVLSLPSKFDIWYHYLTSVSCIIPFILGILCMILYYCKFHPSMKPFSFLFHNNPNEIVAKRRRSSGGNV